MESFRFSVHKNPWRCGYLDCDHLMGEGGACPGPVPHRASEAHLAPKLRLPLTFCTTSHEYPLGWAEAAGAGSSTRESNMNKGQELVVNMVCVPEGGA